MRCSNCETILGRPESIREGICRDCVILNDEMLKPLNTGPIPSGIRVEYDDKKTYYMGDDGIKVLERNPKYAQGIRKFTMCVVPACVLGEVGVAMLEGAYKYGAYNYRQTKIDASTYYDSTMRHVMSWWEGEDMDPDSGLHHITKAITSLVVLRDSMINDMIIDDRPPSVKGNWKDGLNAVAANLHEKYGDKDVKENS